MSAEVKYLRARYDEEETDARAVPQYNGDGLWVLDPQYDHYDHTRVLWISPAYVLADIAAKRKILDLHEQWPTLVETPPVMAVEPGREEWAAHLTWHLDWVTTTQYRYRFGSEPPTSPIIRALLQPYAGRADFDQAWRDA